MEIWFALVLTAAGMGVLFWWMDRLGGTPLPLIPDDDVPNEPCWTEELRTEDGLSYGRYGCYHGQLDEMEARVRRSEFGPRSAD